MNADMLLQHFNHISEAPNAVARLRRFILDLAVRGKLVEQDPNDEPAPELLKRIQVEKVRLAKEGKIKKTAPLPLIEFDNQPFLLPANWMWTRLGEIGDWGSGSTPPRGNSEYYDGDVTWLKSGELGDSLARSGSEERVSNLALQKCSFRLNQPGDVLIAMYGATIGKLAILAEPAVTNQAVCGCTSFKGVLNKYLYLFLLSRREDFHGQSEGGAQPNISKVKIVSSLFSLPPIAEQHRIVAKVDELMALCDQLQAAQNEREARRDRLVAASLNQIQNPDDLVTVFLDQLSRLTTRPAHIKQLRQTILNLAVSGHLVPQDSNDEPAAELLKRINFEKAKLVEAGAIRKLSDLAKLATTEEPFILSHGWIWERLGTLGYTQTGTTPPTSKPECFGGETPFVTPSDLTGTITTYEGKGLTDVGVSHSRLIQKNSVLMVCIGSTIGKTNVVDREVCCNQQINTVTPFVEGMTSYFSIAMRSAYFQELVFAKAGMGTLPILSKGKWELLPIPLPSLAEQHRIVAKVDELMALCDQLEVQLVTTQSGRRRLLEAVLRDALTLEDATV